MLLDIPTASLMASAFSSWLWVTLWSLAGKNIFFLPAPSPYNTYTQIIQLITMQYMQDVVNTTYIVIFSISSMFSYWVTDTLYSRSFPRNAVWSMGIGILWSSYTCIVDDTASVPNRCCCQKPIIVLFYPLPLTQSSLNPLQQAARAHCRFCKA